MWPPHCVQNTPGAEIMINIKGPVETVEKGTNPKFDSYSGVMLLRDEPLTISKMFALVFKIRICDNKE